MTKLNEESQIVSFYIIDSTFVLFKIELLIFTNITSKIFFPNLIPVIFFMHQLQQILKTEFILLAFMHLVFLINLSVDHCIEKLKKKDIFFI